MPPKQGKGKSKMNARDKKKLVEDKTFGMKNKKGKKNQQFVKQVEASLKNKFNAKSGDRKSAKRQERDEKAMMDSLFKPVRPKMTAQQQKKKKQEKQQEPEKKDLYTDDRDSKQGTSADWDQETLERVVNQRHGKGKQPQTDKVCKHFLDAVEKGKYGWFWTCPNGGDSCKYRHALPPGYVLKKDRKKKQEEEATMSLEELIDRERTELSKRKNLTPVNPETFAKWKKKKLAEKKKALREANKKKKKDFMAGNSNKVTGRDFFSFRPEMSSSAGDEEDEEEEGGTFDEYTKKEKENTQEGEVQQKEFDASVYEAKDDDNDDDDDDDDDDDEAASKPAAAASKKDAKDRGEEQQPGVAVGSVAVDADLFAEEMGDLDLDNV